MPLPTVTPALQETIATMAAYGSPVFYTDGNAFAASTPAVRRASYSVVLDTALSNDERILHATNFQASNVIPPSLQKVVVARLPGRQAIHRAELQAITWVFATFPKAIVVTDSSFSHDWVRRLQHGALLAPLAFHPDYDLLQQLQEVLTSDHGIRKTKAHRDSHAIDPLDLYDALGNQMADTLAVQANTHLFPAVVQQLESAKQQIQPQQEMMMTFFFRYLVKLQALRAIPKTEPAIHEEVILAPRDLLTQVQNWHPRSERAFPLPLRDGPQFLGTPLHVYSAAFPAALSLAC